MLAFRFMSIFGSSEVVIIELCRQMYVINKIPKPVTISVEMAARFPFVDNDFSVKVQEVDLK